MLLLKRQRRLRGDRLSNIPWLLASPACVTDLLINGNRWGFFTHPSRNWSEILSMAAPDMARYVKGIATGLSHV